ncbi:OmpA family protein [Pedobacter sp. PAMC26386]|nr:OmpA family protein [Pedobacter sp. PAMC26386]
MMKKIITISLFALFLINSAFAQEQLSLRQQADLQFNRFEYFNAARLYLPIASKKKPDIKVIENLATSYRMMNDYDKAEKWYGIAITDPKAEATSHYYYGEALQRNQKFEAAKEQYKIYGNSTGKQEQVALKINSCDSAVLWMKSPLDIQIKNVQTLNTKAADWGLNYYGNDGLVFTSERTNGKEPKYYEVYKWTGNPWLKLYRASNDGQLKEEISVMTDKNRSSKTAYHVGPMALNGTGDTAYVTISTIEPTKEIPLDIKTKKIKERLYTRRLQLIIAVKKDGKWGDIKSFPYNNVKEFSVGQAVTSKDGHLLYFTSDRPGGQGKTDIWYSEKQTDGSWGNPINCGPEINTPEEEAFPTIGINGKLYYSSRGKIGLGGYDIYVNKGEKDRWSKPSNLKYPVNTTSDDFYLVSNDGKTGYFSSNRPGGAGDDDIYSFNDQTSPTGITLALNGFVYDQQSKAALDSVKVSLTDELGTTINRKITLSNGNFFFGLTGNHNYKVSFSRAGYSSEVKTLNTQGLIKSDTLDMQAFLYKQIFIPGKSYVLKNIYYDFAKSNIRKDAAKELDKLVMIMKDNPAIRIELSSHTDSRGDDQYNQWLSQSRANSAVQYMLDAGIEKNRITARGYGETMLLNRCSNGVKCSPAEHQLNRRTEFKVKKDGEK